MPNLMKCPQCGGSNCQTEKRPNGDSTCLDCNHKCKSSLWEVHLCEVCKIPKQKYHTTCGSKECGKIHFHTKTPEYDNATLEFRFTSKEDRADFLSRYINSGEQNVECYTERWGEDNDWAELRVEPYD